MEHNSRKTKLKGSGVCVWGVVPAPPTLIYIWRVFFLYKSMLFTLPHFLPMAEKSEGTVCTLKTESKEWYNVPWEASFIWLQQASHLTLVPFGFSARSQSGLICGFLLRLANTRNSRWKDPPETEMNVSIQGLWSHKSIKAHDKITLLKHRIILLSLRKRISIF